MKQVIFVDILVLENFFMNYLLLYILDRFCRCRAKWWRLIIAALVGALYVLVALFPSLNLFYTISMKFFISVIIIIIAFSPYEFKKLSKLLILFYLESFILGGTILGIFYIYNFEYSSINGVVTLNRITPGFIILGGLVGLILVKFGFDYFEKYYRTKADSLSIKIILENRETLINVLIDTGNSLKDPITNKPVLIVYINSIIDIFPEKIRDGLVSASNYNQLMDSILESTLKNRMRLIPYKAVGVENGLLVGIRTDIIQIKLDNKELNLKDWIVGLYNKPISNDNSFEGIVGPEIYKI